MKSVILIFGMILGLTCPLKSDILYLKNGEQLNGQLIRITSAGLIFEVRGKVIISEYRTFPFAEVIKVVDDYEEVLFEDNQPKVSDLSEYYNALPQQSSSHFTRDTLYLADSSRQTVYITEISDQFLFYRLSLKQPPKIEKLSLYQISSINGCPVDKYQQINRYFPKEPIISYPIFGIEFNLGFISTHLSTLSNLKIDSTIIGLNPAEPQQFRALDNNYGSLQIGVFLKVNSFISLHALGYYTAGFNNSSTYHDPDEKESYYLAATELHLTYPTYFIKPWVGLGYAHQSFTIISNLQGFDAIWKSQSNCLDFSAGLDINITQDFMLSLAWRSMPFSTKPVAKIYSNDSINLANTIFNCGLKILL